jgi:hypothetical protein
MALSDVALCSRALMRIGCEPIESFEDATAEAEISGALYAPARDAMLSAYGWSFATAQVALERLEDAPVADYLYAYALPDDFLRALSAGTGARGRGIHYRINRNTLQTDAESVLLTYIFLPDEADFPPFFDAALIIRLAADFCIPLTESTSRAESLYQLAESEFRKARQIDAQQDTPAQIESFPLVDVRG